MISGWLQKGCRYPLETADRTVRQRLRISLGSALAVAMGAVLAAGGLARAERESAPRNALAQATPPLPEPSPRRPTLPSKRESKPVAKVPLATSPVATAPPGPEQTAPQTTSEEARFFAAMDQAIAPARDRVPTKEDAQRLRDALKAVSANDLATARRLAAQIAEPAARTLIEWYALRSGIGTAAEFVAFMAAHPQWPEPDLLHRRAEEQLFVGGGTAQSIRDHFGKRSPRSAAGVAALASAHLAAGDEATARSLARKAWRDSDLAASLEAGFLSRFGHLLTEADHKHRIDAFLIDEGRFAAGRAARIAAVRRLMTRLGDVERKKLEARIAIYSRSAAGARLLTALAADGPGAAADWGLHFQKAQLMRQQGNVDGAAALLGKAPKNADLLVAPDAWWLEKRWVAYEFMRAGRHKDAYDLVREPGPLSVNPMKDATFLAGWLALRKLKNAKAALGHLEASRASADGPLSAARAHYWLGRTHDVLRDSAASRRSYLEAAKHFDTFHGSLARQHLEPGPQPIKTPMPKMPTPAAVTAFNDSDVIRAAVLAHQAGAGRGVTRIIVAHLRYRLASEGEMAMLAHLAGALGDQQMALRVGKTAIARAMNLTTYAYPVHPFPNYTPLRRSPERALLLAIARQESEFNPDIVSHAGARGLLQVMPITARHICRDHRIACDIPRLTTDPTYNAMIASAYIGDRKKEFADSYVLTIAGYNAGPGRARQWIRALGDPRQREVDTLDWIETIPFEETREYVKKVLSNLQVYRARLGDPRPLRLAEDLESHRRVTGSEPAPPAPSVNDPGGAR